ncbi:cytochrome P450 [Streptomyces sp. NBC_00704]|uniref:cytochrome P450 n=1 Tax=Streptomyces sp. NBC_00704 TaxID=2975809 RepID=UPI002E343280|nr:cytochrome P450 [Streptomyces sp. NBC_00704]
MDRPTAPVPPPGCPAHQPGGRVPLHGPEFAADPQAYYSYLRHYGPTAPVELAPGVEATLVTDYATALQLLQDSGSFRKDARRWRDLNEGRVSPDSPVAPLLAYRPNAMFSDGAEHLRLRQAITDSMARVDSRRLSRSTAQVSDYLISQFGARGSADLLGDYAKQLPLFVFNELFGCTADIGDRVVFGITGMFDGVNAEQAVGVMFGAISELVALKRVKPGDDVPSWLMEHQSRLTDEELMHQIALLLVAGNEPLRNLIGNTLQRLLTHDAYANQGGLIDEAIDDTLWENPPMQNLAPHYPTSDMEFAGQKVQAGDLMLVSFAAANTGPALTAARQAGSNRAHLAWSAGPHACPSKELARQITVTAIENLLNKLPDVELAVPTESLTWRPGPFNRGLTVLPAKFTPVRAAARPAPEARDETPSQREQGPARGRGERGGVWSQFLNWLTR